jgi:hypothetical protein
VAKSADLSATDAPTDGQNVNTANDDMMGSNPMMMNGMAGHAGYGFNNSMSFGMNSMNGMPNMMASGNWNGMNSLGASPHSSCPSTCN